MDPQDDWCYCVKVENCEYSNPSPEWTSSQLIAVSNAYGLVFIGKNNALQILRVKDLENSMKNNLKPLSEIVFNDIITHVTVNTSSSLLAVGLNNNLHI